MKTILFIALIAILTTGFAAAAVDVTIYDTDKNGMIDITERINLDIDIENSRISPTEAYVIDSYTTDGTVILNEEFQTAFLNPEAYPRGAITTITVIPAVTPDPMEPSAPVQTPEPTPAPEAMPVVPEEDAGGNLTLMMIVGMVLLAGIIMYIYSRQNKEE